MLEDNAGAENATFSERLWPQLWTMEQVKPLVSDVLEAVYADYVLFLENAMLAAGSESSHAEALCVMSMLEGEALFTEQGRRW